MIKVLRTIIICWLICIFSIFFVGCDVESQNPLSSPLEAKIDKQLLGKWQVEDENKNQYVHIKKGSSNELKIFFEGEPLNAEEKEFFFTVFVSEIAGNKYLNMRYVDSSGVSEGYMIMKYVIKDNKLTLWELNGTKVNEALKKGIIKGKSRGIFGAATISDTTGNLKKFVESSSDSELFEYLAQFDKLK